MQLAGQLAAQARAAGRVASGWEAYLSGEASAGLRAVEASAGALQQQESLAAQLDGESAFSRCLD